MNGLVVIPVFLALAAGAEGVATMKTCDSSVRESVVFVVAHPDDLAGSMGTALLLSEQFDVHVIDFTHGERGLTKKEFEDGSCKQMRTAEETAVCAAAGFALHWCDQIDGMAFADQAGCERNMWGTDPANCP